MHRDVERASVKFVGEMREADEVCTLVDIEA